MVTPQALLVSAYDAVSHRYWRDGVTDWNQHLAWRVITLPPRHYAWRVRGNALSLRDAQYAPDLRADYALVVVTSMVDLSGVLAAWPRLHRAGIVMYFHENQFAYPSRDPHDADIALTSIKNALSADHIVFNSAFNRDSFFTGAASLLDKMPDAVPAGLLESLRANANVIPVPLKQTSSTERRPPPASSNKTRSDERRESPLVIVWNHRWEHDKAPERLHRALLALRSKGVAFRLLLLGQQFRQTPEALNAIRHEFDKEIEHVGYVENDADYHDLLSAADVVVSTALHDFQGLAVMDAVEHGCVPVLPDRLAYPEWFGAEYLYESFQQNPEREVVALTRQLERASQLKRSGQLIAPDLSALRWSHLGPRYEAVFSAAQEAAGRRVQAAQC